MKHKLCVFLMVIPLLLPMAGNAAGFEASGDMLRAQLRLRDLGYYTGSIDAAENEAALRAIDAFCEHNNVPRERITDAAYSASALPAPSDAKSDAAAERGPAVTGKAMPWNEVRTLLTPGKTYTVVSCYGGLVCTMRCTGVAGHAHMTPRNDDDADTLNEIFGNLHGFGKQPVTILLGGVSVAASLQACRHSDDAGDADTAYSLYFTDSVSDIGGLPDIDHSAAVRVAAGE